MRHRQEAGTFQSSYIISCVAFMWNGYPAGAFVVLLHAQEAQIAGFMEILDSWI